MQVTHGKNPLHSFAEALDLILDDMTRLQLGQANPQEPRPLLLPEYFASP